MRPYTRSASSSAALLSGTDSEAHDLGSSSLGSPLAALRSGSSWELGPSGSPTRSDAGSLASDAAVGGEAASPAVAQLADTECRYRALATAGLLRAALREDDGGEAGGAERQALAGVLGVERGRNRLLQAELRDSIARQSLRLQVLEEQERRMGALQAGLAESASLPGGLAGRLDEVLQVVHDMNEARRFGGISQQQIAAAIVHQVADMQLQDSYRFEGEGDPLSLRQLLAAYAGGNAGRVALRSSVQGCPFLLPLQSVGLLSFEAYSGLHASYLREVGLQLALGASPEVLASLVNENLMLRLAFLITHWSTYLSFRITNAAALPPTTMQAAAAAACVEPAQAAALHALWRGYSARQAELGAHDAAAKAAVRQQLLQLGAAPEPEPAPFARLLDAAEALSAAGHARTLAQIDFNVRSVFAVLSPRQTAALLAGHAPHHVRLDMLLEHGCIPAPPLADAAAMLS